MKINNVFLIKPVYYQTHYGNMGLPSGLGYISDVLTKVGLENIVVDVRLVHTIEKLQKIIRGFNL